MFKKVKASAFLRQLASYSVLLVFACIMTVVVFRAASDGLMAEIEKITMLRVTQMQHNFDSTIQDMQSISATVSFKKEIIAAINATANGGLDALKLADVREALQDQKYNAGSIGEICVVYPDRSLLVSDQYAYSGDMAENWTQRVFGMSFDETCAMLNDKSLGRVSLYGHPVEGKPVLAVSSPAINSSNYNREAIVCVVLDDALLASLLSDASENGGRMAVITGNEVICYDTEHIDETHSLISALPDGLTSCIIGEGAMMSAIQPSHTTGYRYVSLVAQDDYLHDIHALRSRVYVMLVIFAAMGILLSTLLARSNVKPIHRLLSVLSDDNRIRRNEFEHLETALIDLMQQKRSGVEMQQRYEDVARRHLLAMLLYGKISDEQSFYESNEKLGIGITGSRFCVASIRVMDSGSFRFTDSENAGILAMTIASIVTHEVKSQIKVVSTEHSGDHIFILCLPDYWDQPLAEVCDWNTVVSLLSERFGLKVQIAVSCEQHGLRKIALAYDKVVELFTTAKMYDITRNVFYEDLNPAEQDAHIGSSLMEIEKIIITCILSQEYLSAKNHILTALERPVSAASEGIEPLRHMMRTVVLTLEDIRSLFPKEFFDALDVRGRLLSASDIRELRATVGEIFEALDAKTRCRDAKLAKLAKKIQKFVDENYANPMMSRTYVAEQMGISVSYLSHVLKECSGATILDLIHERRIAVAKDLLINSNLVLQEIAERVGYTNTWTFARAFKNSEGVSPGKYRENAVL